MLESGPRALHLQLGVKLTPRVPCLVDTRPGRAVHYGWAAPVTVQSLDPDTGLAELIILELEPSVRRPRIPSSAPNVKNHMAATAKPSAAAAVRCEPEEDIAAIAKQISDHAEAIYQTWKSRGLAPADILTCHGGDPTAAAGTFCNALAAPPAPASPPMELLAQAPNMDNSRLERLVSSFVVEDRARVAARDRRAAPGPASTIQYALQKFEKVAPSNTPAPTPVVISSEKPKLSPKPKFVPPATVEFTLPGDLGGEVRARPVLQTWPLKDRPAEPLRRGTAALDQVAVEERKLINALKNGVALGGTADASAAATTNTRWGPRTTRRPEQQQMPHPEPARPHLRHVPPGASAPNPIRPFLTRGSVAERVLIFERCPSSEMMQRPRIGQKPRISQGGPPPLSHTTLQRHVRANRHVPIPRFYFPHGRPAMPAQDTARARVAAGLARLGERLRREDFADVARAFELPLYWKAPLHLAAATWGCEGTPQPGQQPAAVSRERTLAYWTALTGTCHDEASRFVHVLTRGRRPWLSPEDLVTLVQDVVDTHPGLTFLKEAAEFHSRYVHTVIARIFYSVNRSWSGRISLAELRRSDLLSVLRLLEHEDDINQVTAYFSYEHFYVIYCKFWELDRDHDLFIDRADLARHNDHALSSRIVDRIFSGAVTRRPRHATHPPDRMSYTEFVWFLLSEEDKTHPTAVEYWFRCMDLDGDGYLSMYELEYFYEEQMHRMEAIGIETLPFQDCLCQMLDMVKPRLTGCITLADLKRCKMTPIFFDTFFNLEKYLDHEQRDPFASQRDQDEDGQDMSDWDRYAAEEYELLVAEEGGGLDSQEDSAICSDEIPQLKEPPAQPPQVNGHAQELTEIDTETSGDTSEEPDDDTSDAMEDEDSESDQCSTA